MDTVIIFGKLCVGVLLLLALVILALMLMHKDIADKIRGTNGLRGLLISTGAILICLMLGFLVGRCGRNNSSCIDTRIERDTVVRTKIVKINNPEPVAQANIGHKTYTLPSYYLLRVNKDSVNNCHSDSVCNEITCGTGAGGVPRSCDSVTMDLPLIQRHYADSTYDAWISGPIDPRLDSVRVYTKEITITQKEWKPPKHWHIGVMVGYGYTPKGFQPYIGVGLTCSVFSF